LVLKRYGGLAVAQDPAEASHPDMPRSAIQYVKVDCVARISEIAKLLNELVDHASPNESRKEAAGMRTVQTMLTCPECRGALEEIRSAA